MFRKPKREKHYRKKNVSGKSWNPSCQKKSSSWIYIYLTKGESNSLLTNWEEIAKKLNNFFANAVKNLIIPNYEYSDFLAENIDDTTLKAIAKWRNQPSILAIASEYKNRANFEFCF